MLLIDNGREIKYNTKIGFFGLYLILSGEKCYG